MQITRRSPFSGRLTTLEVPVTADQLAAWYSGQAIQTAMPTVPAELREFLMTGITPWEWNDLFGSELDEEEEVDFCQQVADHVEQLTGYPDSADLCFSLLEQGVIAETATVASAAALVIQHLSSGSNS